MKAKGDLSKTMAMVIVVALAAAMISSPAMSTVEYWFSVSEPAVNGGLTLGIGTHGDLLAYDPTGMGFWGVIATNEELLLPFVSKPSIDYGLDAVDALELDWSAAPLGMLVAFSTSVNVSPTATSGDVLFTDGSVIPNGALLASAFPGIELAKPAEGENHGLDALDILPLVDPPIDWGQDAALGFGTTYAIAFSTEVDVWSFGGMTLLASAGDIIFAGLPGPWMPIPNIVLTQVHGVSMGDYGLDGIDTPASPSAEIEWPPLPLGPNFEETGDVGLGGVDIFFSYEQATPASDELPPPGGDAMVPVGGPLGDGTLHGDWLSSLTAGPYLPNNVLVAGLVEPVGDYGLDAMDAVFREEVTPTDTPTQTATETPTDTPGGPTDTPTDSPTCGPLDYPFSRTLIVSCDVFTVPGDFFVIRIIDFIPSPPCDLDCLGLPPHVECVFGCDEFPPTCPVAGHTLAAAIVSCINTFGNPAFCAVYKGGPTLTIRGQMPFSLCIDGSEFTGPPGLLIDENCPVVNVCDGVPDNQYPPPPIQGFDFSAGPLEEATPTPTDTPTQTPLTAVEDWELYGG